MDLLTVLDQYQSKNKPKKLIALSKIKDFNLLIKNFLTLSSINLDDLKHLEKHLDHDYFKKYQNYSKLYNFLIKHPHLQEKFLQLFSENNHLLGFIFCSAAYQKDIPLLRKMLPYSHQDFSAVFIEFYQNKSLYDKYTNPNLLFFYDVVLTNQKIKSFLENCLPFKVIKTSNNVFSFIHKKYKADLQTINIVNDGYFNDGHVYVDLFPIFAKHQFNFNTPNQAGNTPLHLYMYELLDYKNTSLAHCIIKIHQIIKAGADLSVKNKQNISFIDLWLSPKNQQKISEISNDLGMIFSLKNNNVHFSDLVDKINILVDQANINQKILKPFKLKFNKV